MRRFALGVLVCGLACCSPGRLAKEPPRRFQGDATVAVAFVADVDAACVAAGQERASGTHINGCLARDRIVRLPNPCVWPNPGDTYAQLACHELGHVNGWPANHPD